MNKNDMGKIIIYKDGNKCKFSVEDELLKVDKVNELIYKEEIAKIVDQELDGDWNYFRYTYESTTTTVYQKFPRGRD